MAERALRRISDDMWFVRPNRGADAFPAMPTDSSFPLSGLRVVEMGSLIAGPFAAKTLGEWGAEVIKIEPPGVGDPLRRWRVMDGDTSLWWQVQSRNKKSLALDLTQPEGQQIARDLIATADVLIENFRPGKMEEWDMGWEALSALNPKLIMLRVSGYGQTGPYRDRPGFGVIGEAMGGLRHLCAEPGQTPVRCGISIGDTLAALHGVIGVLLALRHREKNGGRGQMIDVSLFESVFNVMESLLPEYDRFGIVRQPAGGALPGITPSNAYPCAGGGHILIAGNSDGIFRRLMQAIGRPELAADPALARNDGRSKRAAELDAAIAAWTQERPLAEALEVLHAAGVPVGRVYTAADIAADPHYQARGMIAETELRDGRTLRVPGIVPKLSAVPGLLGRGGPALGEHTAEVLASLGVDEARRADLAARGLV